MVSSSLVDSPAIAEKHRTTIADYVGDMVALETHIEEAIDRQLTEVKDDRRALSAVEEFHGFVKAHREALKSLQDATGRTAGNPLKSAGAAVLGAAAGLVNLVRTEGVSKALRDDYAAFSLAAISYSMLHTTALSLGDHRVGEIAERHLRDYASALQRINRVMPDVVLRELRNDEHTVDDGAAEATREMVRRSWEST